MLTNDGLLMLTHFGKDFSIDPIDSIEINTIHNPVLYQYYRRDCLSLNKQHMLVQQ